MDGKLKWSDPADQWTQTVFEFFTLENSHQTIPFVAMREHMQIDYVWRYDVYQPACLCVAAACAGLATSDDRPQKWQGVEVKGQNKRLTIIQNASREN
jgi:sugar phosphate permease